ncbi:MAG: TolC family protein [Nitrospirae bacterium]|nr:TolC family protein [Nitrospirota bacterium]
MLELTPWAVSLRRLLAYFIAVIVILGGMSLPVFSQTGNFLQLTELLQEALANNPELLSARQRWEAAREEITQTGSLEDPQLTITQWAIPSNFNIGNADETWYGISQSFPFPGKRSLKGQIAVKASEAAEQDYLAKAREVMARVKVAYDQLFLIQKSIELHREHQTLLEEFLRIADEKYSIGQVAQQDLLKAQVELSKLHNSLLVLEQEEVSARAETNSLLNRPSETALGRVEDLVYHAFSFRLEDLTKQALEKRPEFRIAKLMIEKSEQARVLARKNYLPDFMVEVSYWDVHTGPNKWEAVGKINLPWIFKSKYDARIRQAVAEEAGARADQAVIHSQTLFELTDLFTKVRTAEQLIGVYQNGVLPQAEQSLEAARIGYQAGKVDFLNLIDSERTLLDLQLEYFGTLVRFWQSVAQLERTVGQELKK